MCRSNFVRLLILLQNIVNEGRAEEEAPADLGTLCNAMVIDQGRSRHMQVFQDDDYELLSSAVMMNPNIALVVTSYPQLELSAVVA